MKKLAGSMKNLFIKKKNEPKPPMSVFIPSSTLMRDIITVIAEFGNCAEE